MGEPPASAEEVVKMINDYLQKGIEPDRNALKYVTDIQIAGDRCLWVSIKDFDMDVYSSYDPNAHYEYNEENGELTVSDTVFDIYHRDLENDVIEEDTEIVPWGTITDISFIPKYFPYLVGLEISFNRIADISPLKGMTGLRYLGMAYNEIGDISSLSGLTQMESLWLEHNNISDISAISDMMQMENLWLEHNNISDISALSDMTQMHHLTLGHNVISDISALSDMTQIQGLFLEYNNISNISALSGMTQMQSLSLENNNISDISAIAGMTALEGLHISNNHIFDLTPITGLKSLEYVYIRDNTGDDYAEDTEFNLPLLKHFDLDGVIFGNVTFSNMPELEWLVIDDVSAVSVNIHDLDTVAHFYIGVYEEGVFNKIENLTISHLKSLENISTSDSMTLSNVVINDVPLLNEISFINCGLQNISIDKAPLLKDVRLRGNNLSEGKITALKEKFPYAEIYS